LRDVAQGVREALRRFGARYALLFGSALRGRLREDSDIDVAVKLAVQDPVERFKARARLAGELEGLFKRRVDVVVLNDAPIDLAYAAFREYETLYVEDVDELLRDKTEAVMKYLDFKYLLDRRLERLMEELRR